MKFLTKKMIKNKIGENPVHKIPEITIKIIINKQNKVLKGIWVLIKKV